MLQRLLWLRVGITVGGSVDVLSFFFPYKEKTVGEKVIFYLIKGLKCYTFDLMLVVIHFARTGIGGVALLCFHVCIIDEKLLPKKRQQLSWLHYSLPFVRR